MHTDSMYSLRWFKTFAPNVEAPTSLEVQAISALCPRPDFSRVLEIGCGTGRVTGPLSSLGYDVVGIDISPAALQVANIHAPGPTYVALDQRNVAKMSWMFDGVFVLWNSIGFGTRADDEETLRGAAQVLRPGGKFLIDLYHPEWLADQPDSAIHSRGASARRWIEDGRCFHIITYADGAVDDIQFNVYLPDEIAEVLVRAGLVEQSRMTWWTTHQAPSRASARFQLACIRV